MPTNGARRHPRRNRAALTSITQLVGAGSVHVEDLAGIAGGSRSWIYKLIYAGTVKATRVGRQYRISEREALRILREMGHEMPNAN